jgi:hypothetical protein
VLIGSDPVISVAPSASSFACSLLHFGQRSCTEKVVAPQSRHRLPYSWEFSSGQVEISGASAFCI